MEAAFSELIGGLFIIVIGGGIVVGLIRLIFGPIDMTKHNNYTDDNRSKYI
jgi:hypothetical protein